LIQGYPIELATHAALHLGQRILIDRVQQIYCTNEIFNKDKNFEVRVRTIAFIQVIQDLIRENPMEQRQKYGIEIMERINWYRILKNWREKNLKGTLGKVLFLPSMLGLTKSALRNPGFISAASFQTTSHVLSNAALFGQVDYLLGLKENLILGTRLPIGTNARLLNIDIFF
jgi:DNA-directed RNA polymerase subunit beta'